MGIDTGHLRTDDLYLDGWLRADLEKIKIVHVDAGIWGRPGLKQDVTMGLDPEALAMLLNLLQWGVNVSSPIDPYTMKLEVRQTEPLHFHEDPEV